MNTYEIMFLSASLTVNIFLFTELIKYRFGANSILVTKDVDNDEVVNSVIKQSFGSKQIIAIVNISKKTVITTRKGYSVEFVKDTSNNNNDI